MANEKEKKDGELAKREETGTEKGLTMKEILEHPVVQRMNSELTSLKKLLQNLPEAVGRAVAQANQPETGERIPLVNVKSESIEILPGKLKVNGETFDIKAEQDRLKAANGASVATEEPPKPQDPPKAEEGGTPEGQ